MANADHPGMADIEVRLMRPDDLSAVATVMDAAFCTMREAFFGRPVQPPAFPDLMYRYRLAADPAGCLVAVHGGTVLGALFSVARGPIAWFGPLATDPAHQAHGIGRALVLACMQAWRHRGVDVMGLETYGTSDFHVHSYGRLGFRPGWNGIAFAKQHGAAAWPNGVDTGGDLPSLDFVRPGFDPRGDVEATRSCGAGDTLVTEGGIAICHVKDTFLGQPGTSFVPLLAARDGDAFKRLLMAIESTSAGAGNRSVIVRAPGSCWATYQGLSAAGYRPGRVMVRMKQGTNLDYDRPDLYYCDSWL